MVSHGVVVVCIHARLVALFFFFFFNDTATTEIYTLSLHDALPIYRAQRGHRPGSVRAAAAGRERQGGRPEQGPGAGDGDRKSTRLNSSHSQISYAVFCLKKKKTTNTPTFYSIDIPCGQLRTEQYSI